MKKILIASLFALASIPAMAQTGAIGDWCNLGKSQAQIQGLSSTNFQQGMVSKCRITVYLTGTTQLATIYADANNTHLDNPFTAGVNGQWLFYALTNQGYDVVADKGTAPNTYPSPVTLCTDCFPARQITTVTNAIQVNGVDLKTPSPANFSDTATAKVTNPSAGVINITALTNMSMQVQDPLGGQNVVLYPNSFTPTLGDLGTGNLAGGNTSAAITNGPGGGPLTNNTWGITWSNFSLPSDIPAVNVTSVYAFMVSSVTGNNSVNYGSCSGTGGSAGLTPSGNLTTGTNWTQKQFTGLTGITGANIGTITCTARTERSMTTGFTEQYSVPSVGLIVHYTGNPSTYSLTAIQVASPLFINPSLNLLGIDPQASFHGLDILGIPIASLPAQPLTSSLAMLINNGSTSSDCTTGGGTNYVLCRWNGSGWASFVVGGGISALTGDVTASGSGSVAATVTQTHLSAPLPVAQGGTGTTTPGIVAGTNITVTGTWPNQTVNATSGGSGTVNSGTANQVAYYPATAAAVSGNPRLTENGTTLGYTGTGGFSGPSFNGTGSDPFGNFPSNPSHICANGDYYNNGGDFTWCNSLGSAPVVTTVQAGSNVTLSGQGTKASPLVINSTGATSTPALRGTGIQASSAASYTVPWPTGTVAGDYAVIFTGGGFGPSATPTGWTQLDYESGTNWIGAVYAKTLTAADITAGSVSISMTGTFDSTIAIATFVGTPMGIKELIQQRNGSGASSVTLNTDAYPSISDMMLYFGSNRAASTNTVSLGTMQRQANDGSAASGALYAGSPSATGPLSPTFSYSLAGTGNYQVALAVSAVPPAGMVKIAQTTLTSTASSITVGNIPSGGTNLKVVVNAKTSSGSTADSFYFTFNADTGTNYNCLLTVDGSTTTFTASGSAPSSGNCGAPAPGNSLANYFGNYEGIITNYASTSQYKTIVGLYQRDNSNVPTSGHLTATWKNAANPLTTLTITPVTGPNFLPGTTITVYLMQ